MVQKKSTKRATSTTSRSKKPVKKTTVKSTAARRSTTKKAAQKRSTRTRTPVSQKVDYYPNRVSLLTATAAVLILLMLGLITGL